LPGRLETARDRGLVLERLQLPFADDTIGNGTFYGSRPWSEKWARSSLSTWRGFVYAAFIIDVYIRRMAWLTRNFDAGRASCSTH
jgi:hypothetical protein